MNVLVREFNAYTTIKNIHHKLRYEFKWLFNIRFDSWAQTPTTSIIFIIINIVEFIRVKYCAVKILNNFTSKTLNVCADYANKLYFKSFDKL